MKATTVLVLFLVGGAGLLLLAEGVSATTVCALPVANTCHGIAHVSTPGTLGASNGARCFAYKTVNAAPTCTTSGITPQTNLAWEQNAGTCVPLYYYDVTTGASPAAPPNKVTILVLHDATSTTIKTFQTSAAEPANGASNSFCATTDGNAGSPARAGTYRIRLRLVKDDGAGGVGNYDISTDGTATVGSIINYDRGAIRANGVVSAITTNSPTGGVFAYGTAGDELIDVTGTFTPPNGDANVETMRAFVLDSPTLLVGAAGTTVDVDSGSFTSSFTADTTFPANSYVAGIDYRGNAALTGERWATLASTGHGAGLTVFSDTAIYKTAPVSIDPRIVFDTDGSVFSTADDDWVNRLDTSGGILVDTLNRGETVYSATYILNARSERLTRSMTIAREDLPATVCGSALITPTAGLFSFAGPLSTGGSCLAANTPTGSPRYYRATNTDQNHVGVTVYNVSPWYWVDAHPQLAATLVPDDYPTEDAGESFDYGIRSVGGVDATDTFRGWCGVQSVRKDLNVDTSGSAVTRQLIDPVSTVRSSGTADTDSTGFTTTSLNFLTSTPVGAWDWKCDVAFNGNTGTDTEAVEFFVDSDGGGETVYTGADPLTIFAHQPANGTVPIAVHSRMLDGEARVGAASSIFVSVFDWPSMTPVVTLAGVTEVDAALAPGSYAYAFDYPYAGAFLVAANTTDGATPIGAHNVITVGFGNISADSNATLALLLDKLGPQGEPVNIESATVDFWLPLLFWIAVILFCMSRDWTYALWAAFPGLITVLLPELFPAPLNEFGTLFLLFTMGAVAEYWSFRGKERKQDKGTWT